MESNLKRRNRKFFWVGLFTFIFLLIIATFNDLEFSIMVVDPSQYWAILIQDYGEIPGYLAIILSISYFLAFYTKINDFKNLLLSLLTLIILVILNFVILSKIFVIQPLILIVVSIILPFCLILLVKRVVKKKNTRISNFATITIIMAIINPLIFVQLTKTFWGRVRFRNLLPDYSNYTPWFLPQGINGNRSFPSGHAAMGWMLLPFTTLLNKTNSRAKILLWIIILLWGIVVCLGRIVIGAHYLSDVLISTFTSFVCFHWSKTWIIHKKVKD